jgi:Leu/Phe-tRNA-protein transferase
MIPGWDPAIRFPPVEYALRDPNGLLAAARDLSPVRLLDAIAVASFPGTAMAIRSCGGPPIRGWCSSSTIHARPRRCGA